MSPLVVAALAGPLCLASLLLGPVLWPRLRAFLFDDAPDLEQGPPAVEPSTRVRAVAVLREQVATWSRRTEAEQARLPGAALASARTLCRDLDALLVHAGAHDLGESLGAYLSMPAEHARTAATAEGVPLDDELVAALSALEDVVEEIEVGAYADLGQSLAVSRRYLRALAPASASDLDLSTSHTRRRR